MERLPPRPQGVLVIGLYADGATLKQLGPQYGVADASVRNYLIRASVTLRPAKRQPGQAVHG